MSDGKGSNINKFVKGRETQFLSFWKSVSFCYSLRERKTRICFSVISINNIETLFSSTGSIKLVSEPIDSGQEKRRWCRQECMIKWKRLIKKFKESKKKSENYQR